MILTDVNILVHAFRTDSPEHLTCRAWLDDVVNGDARYGMALQVLSGVIRITTHPKVFAMPSSLDFEFSNSAISFSINLTASSFLSRVNDTGRFLSGFAPQRTRAGNLVPDAWFAALAIESGCEWITLDHDYVRFPNLQWRVPV